MALFKFTKSIFENKPIDVYNYGKMERDFTYIDDLVHSIFLLIDKVPSNQKNKVYIKEDSISPVAPYRVVNIGNSRPSKLTDFISAIEEVVGKKSKQNLMPIQQGDVPATWADISLLKKLTGYSPNTKIREGIEKFVLWYKKYYNV